MEWVLPNFEISWPIRRSDEVPVELQPDQIRQLQSEAQLARATREARMVALEKSQLRLLVPFNRNGIFEGWIHVGFNARRLADHPVVQLHARDYLLHLQVDQFPLITPEAQVKKRDEHRVEWNQKFFGSDWQLSIQPATLVYKRELSWLPVVLLVAGILLSLLAGMQVRNLQLAQNQSRQMEATNRRLEKEVAERLQVEENLRGSELHFRSVTESAHDAIISIDANGQVIFWNKAASRLFGYTAEEMKSQSLSVIIPERYRSMHDAGMQRMRSGKPERLVGRTAELHALRRDGSEFPVELSLSRWTIGSDNFFTAILRDISERRKAEQALQQAHAGLEKRVEERTHELGLLNQALKKEIGERGRVEQELENHRAHLEDLVKSRTMELQDIITELEAFSYTVSHDLRAPLRAMQGFSDALLEEYSEQLDDLGKDYARRIAFSARKMDRLIQDLLVYSKLNRLELKLEPVPLNDAIQEAMAQLEKELEVSRAQLQIPELPIVVAHQATLVQVLTNLLSNALKFVEPGKVPEVIISHKQAGAKTLLSIEDNGIGIPPEHQARIFKVFERLHTSEAYPGTGVGLAIVKKGMERMGGTVSVNSVAGKGATFVLQLQSFSPTETPELPKPAATRNEASEQTA
jgi:PAS domain S-box-containing protein